MPRQRTRSQLAIQAPPELLERLRAAAAAQRRTVTGLVIEWIEAGLIGALPAAAAAPAAGAELLERVAALEAGLSELQAHRAPASPERVNPAPRSGERLEPLRVPLGRGQLEIIGANHLRPPADPEAASPERVNPADRSGDALTTAELADQTGTNRAAWNNWAGGADRVGQVRHHPTAGSWRLIGKGPAPGGGPDRWLWEPVEA
jgi:hypothetical protein